MPQEQSNLFNEHPILNSPYECPRRHWELVNGIPTQRIKEYRREADFITPIPSPKKSKGGKAYIQDNFDFISKNTEISNKISTGQQYHLSIINRIRNSVSEWRKLPSSQWKVTSTTEKLLKYWRTHEFSSYRPFFCQLEAAETAIWLVEVAAAGRTKEHREIVEYLEKANNDCNPGLSRIALKLATGAGKTTIMAMLIAWQTLNAVRSPRKQNFTKGFLIVAPGITIRDRLRVLLPNDPDSYYQRRELVPADMLLDLQQARVVITNYHALKLREKLEISKGTRSALEGWRHESLPTLETEGEMLQRVMPELMNLERVLVINDEAHHCYQENPNVQEEKQKKLSAEEKKEAEDNKETARVWINGLKIVQNKFKSGILRVFDLSATPFFLSGSGYVEGTIFPWTMSDFSLMDAIECGIVKLPRVPVTGNVASNTVPMYRELWEHIKKKMPKKKANEKLDPQQLPSELQTALDSLYGHYEKTFEEWKRQGISIPPCFIVVCNNTATSKLIYDYISGYYRDKDNPNTFVNGRFELFRNFDENNIPYARPRTLLIDSYQLDKGDVLDKNFSLAAKDEIERFKREILIRGGSLASELRNGKELSEATILREVMNTVGKQGQLGESIRCVVSVSMLTEGWDANNVTHILGVRAFGTQLLCEQVIGRALRRYSYNINEDGLFDTEYADVFGIPFDFADKQVKPKIKPPQETVHVHAVLPDREHLEIRFPRVAGYRVELPNEKLEAAFNNESQYILKPEDIGETITENSSIVGESAVLDLSHLESVRDNTIKMHLTRYILMNHFREENEAPRLYLFGQVKNIVSKWYDKYLNCVNGTKKAQLIYKTIAERASEKICVAITRAHQGEKPIRVILDPYNKEGSSRYVNFNTSKQRKFLTNPEKSQLNYHICDSDWEMEFCRVAEHHEKVKAYVKNQAMGFEIPYTLHGEQHLYIPDFILLVDDGHGEEDLLHLVVEIKGFKKEDAVEKKSTMETYWIPGVNRLKKFGRWAFAELDEVENFKLDLENVFYHKINDQFNAMIEKAVRSHNG